MTKTLKHFQRIILVPIQWVDTWLKQTPGGNLAKCCSNGEDLAPLCLHDRIYLIYLHRGFPGGTVVKNSPANARNVHLIPTSGRSPGEVNGNHSSILTWKILWTEEPGKLQSMGSLGVGHDWATSLSLFIFMHWRRKWQPTPVFLPGESQGQRSLVGCRLWGRTESDMAEAT